MLIALVDSIFACSTSDKSAPCASNGAAHLPWFSLTRENVEENTHVVDVLFVSEEGGPYPLTYIHIFTYLHAFRVNYAKGKMRLRVAGP